MTIQEKVKLSELYSRLLETSLVSIQHEMTDHVEGQLKQFLLEKLENLFAAPKPDPVPQAPNRLEVQGQLNQQAKPYYPPYYPQHPMDPNQYPQQPPYPYQTHPAPGAYPVNQSAYPQYPGAPQPLPAGWAPPQNPLQRQVQRAAPSNVNNMPPTVSPQPLGPPSAADWERAANRAFDANERRFEENTVLSRAMTDKQMDQAGGAVAMTMQHLGIGNE